MTVSRMALRLGSAAAARLEHVVALARSCECRALQLPPPIATSPREGACTRDFCTLTVVAVAAVSGLPVG